MSQQPAPEPNAPSPLSPDPLLSRAKEAVASLLALIIVLTLLVMLWKAFRVLSTDSDKAFQQVKDLLLFINPLVGVVIGYYFNKVSTEARAESAEATAQAATTTAQQAAEARQEAENRASEAESVSDSAREALDEIIPAAEAVLARQPATAALADGNGEAASVAGARLELQHALQRARRRVR